jgi:hypothetical protein
MDQYMWKTERADLRNPIAGEERFTRTEQEESRPRTWNKRIEIHECDLGVF